MLRAGNPEAWNQAFTCFFAVAFEAARTRLGNGCLADCEDVASETVAELLDQVAKVSVDQELKPLVAAIARNKATDRLRRISAAKRGGNRVESLDALEQWQDAQSQDDPLDQLTIVELRELLLTLGSTIKKEHRVLLYDHYFHQMTYEEIAKKHQISINTVGVYLKRALASMRLAIARKPKLMNDLLQLFGEGGMVRLLLPLLSAIELGRWFFDTGIRYQDESRFIDHRPLTDELRLERASETLPQEPVLAEEKRVGLIALAEKKYSASFDHWQKQNAARLAQELKESRQDRKSRAAAITIIGLSLLGGLIFAASCS